jgi:hypothetical protein
VIVRWADDFVVGFEHREDAERFWTELRERLATFGLELHAEKTRLIEFGRHAARNRAARGLGKPETFQFLGFTHVCGKRRKSGRFKLTRLTDAKRMRAKLLAIKREMWKRMHHPIPEQGRWLARVLSGHYNYYAVPDNIEALSAFLNRSSGAGSNRFGDAARNTGWTGRGCNVSLINGCLYRAFCIPGRSSDSPPSPKAGAQCGSSARWDLRGGRPAMAVPTATASWLGRGVVAEFGG